MKAPGYGDSGYCFAFQVLRGGSIISERVSKWGAERGELRPKGAEFWSVWAMNQVWGYQC